MSLSVGIFPAQTAVKGEGYCELLYPHSLAPSLSLSINVCNHILELLCDFKVHLFHAAQTLIIPAVISKIIKYWLTHHSTLCRVMLLPEDLEQFLKADAFWLIHYSNNFRVASFTLKENTKPDISGKHELRRICHLIARREAQRLCFSKDKVGKVVVFSLHAPVSPSLR